MTKDQDNHAGSGLDKPDPKSLLEKVGYGLRKIIPDKPAPQQTGPATTIPPAD